MKNAPNDIRIVIDTNVFISAIVFGGIPRKVVDVVAEDTATFVVSEEILTEIRRIIVSKFPEFLPDLEKAEKLIDSDAVWVKLGLVSLAVSRDPDDNKFIETALVGECQYIVSGDKDLLDLKAYKNIKIVNASEFLDLMKRSS